MKSSKKLNVALWIVQGLLALFFAVGSGAPKLILPPEMIPMPIPLPHWFLLFIGTCEVLGALGLILPGVLRTRPGLTVAAATCLVLLTLCAATYQLLASAPGNAVLALLIGALAAFVAYGRWRLAPLPSSRQQAPAYAK
jgi:putative oxidoreductase